MSTVDEAAIRAATNEIQALEPAFARRFAAARDLLLRGGWTAGGTIMRFPGGETVTHGACDCQEGRGPVVCLHEIACRILGVAHAAHTPPAPACDDCGSALTPTTVARIGPRTLTVCRPCHRARIAAGRQRQLACDAQFVAQAIGT